MSSVAQDETLLEAKAAEWYARVQLGRPSSEDRREFEEWLARSAANARAFADYERLWSSLGPIGAEPRIAAARGEVLIAAGTRRTRQAQWRGAAIAAVVILGVVAVLAVAPRQFSTPSLRSHLPDWLGGPEKFATTVGQSSSVSLEDGSTAVLNTSSALVPTYSSTERAVQLIRGQALFYVARDPARPFVVYAGDRRIVALGTSFDVRVIEHGVTVTLIEGEVSVTTASEESPSPGTELSPGQQLTAVRGDEVSVKTVDVESVTSWRQGHLLFSDEPLARAVTEVNRYSRIQLELADPGLADIRVSGVFRTGQIGGFVSALEARFPVVVRETTSDRVLLDRR